MKNKIKSKKLYLLLFVALCNSNLHADILETLGIRKDVKIDISIGNKREKTIEDLKHTIATTLDHDKKLKEELLVKSEKVKARIDQLESMIKKDNGQNDFITDKLFILKSTNLVLTDIKATRQNFLDILKQNIEMLENIDDEKLLQNVEHEKKALYSFEDLDVFNRQIANQQDKITHLTAEKNELKLDVENVRKKMETTAKQYKEKIKKQVDFAQQTDFIDTSLEHQSTVLDLEVKLSEYEQQFLSFKVEEQEARYNFSSEAISLEEKKLNALKKRRDSIIRTSLRVEEKDVEDANNKLKKERKICFDKTDGYVKQIEKYGIQLETYKKELQLFTKKDTLIEIDGQHDEWTTPATTVEEFISLIERGYKKACINSIELQIDFYKALLELEKETLRENEIHAQSVQSWYYIRHQLFTSSNQLSSEIARYENLKAELLRERSIYNDKRDTITNRLSLQNRELANNKKCLETIKEHHRTIFITHHDAYNHCLSLLDKAQHEITQHIETVGMLIETYSKLTVATSNSIKQTQNMIVELKHVSLWQRSGGAISREGLANIAPDIQQFFKDIRILGKTYFGQWKTIVWSKYISSLFPTSFSLFWIILKYLLLFGLFFFLYRRLPLLITQCLKVDKEYKGVFFFSRLAVVCIRFIQKHWIGITIWITLLFWFGVNVVSHTYPSVLFYLGSIIYLNIMSFLFLRSLEQFNESYDYEMYSRAFEKRLSIIGPLFLYLTITTFFFREAFMLIAYPKSELPSVLLALYSIVGRILLLFLIRKEDLLGIIPARSPIGRVITRIIDNYFYVLAGCLVLIMVLSDPHIGGYDNLVSYLFIGVFGTILVSRGMFLFYGFCKRMISFTFFSSDGETLKERFMYAKSIYAVSITLLFILFSIISIIFILFCWEKVVPSKEIFDFFSETLIRYDLDGQSQKLSLLKIIGTLLFIPGGFLAGFFIDKFLIHRIFNALLIDSGMHNAVSTIFYYIIVLIFITLGLWYQGFGYLVQFYLFPILFGMAWALRDIFNDFIAYFVILIQRPLKIGDYIQINDEIRGVVRKITPRAIILRRKQSYHLIVPNSRIIQEPILNWDYVRGFIAFPDISVGIRYSTDPEKTKQLLLQAIASVTNVLKSPIPIVRLEEFSPSGYVFLLRGFISSEMTLEQWNIASDVRFAVVKTLHKNGIELAYPVKIIRMANNLNASQYLPDAELSTPGIVEDTIDKSLTQ